MEGSKEEEDFHREMRRRIQAVRTNPALSAAEKGREIQRLMTSRFTEATSPEAAVVVSNTLPRVTFADEAAGVHGCAHYRTHCSVKSACCARWFTCRRCHDEQVSEHKINRYATEEMYCFFCATVQPVAQSCHHCGKELAKYYCGICKLWSDGENAHQIFHCAKCGLCRVGEGAYEHCDVCHMCLPAGKAHKHMERAFESNCPICGEFLFTSTRPAITPEPCHHPLHSHCYHKLLKKLHFACPICHKTYADINMAPQWEYVRNLIRSTPLPEEYRGWKVEALCNDCVKKSVVPFHFFGAECPHCRGYNTSITATYREDGAEVDVSSVDAPADASAQDSVMADVDDDDDDDDDDDAEDDAEQGEDEDDGDDADVEIDEEEFRRFEAALLAGMARFEPVVEHVGGDVDEAEDADEDEHEHSAKEDDRPD